MRKPWVPLSPKPSVARLLVVCAHGTGGMGDGRIGFSLLLLLMLLLMVLPFHPEEENEGAMPALEIWYRHKKPHTLLDTTPRPLSVSLVICCKYSEMLNDIRRRSRTTNLPPDILQPASQLRRLLVILSRAQSWLSLRFWFFCKPTELPQHKTIAMVVVCFLSPQSRTCIVASWYSLGIGNWGTMWRSLGILCEPRPSFNPIQLFGWTLRVFDIVYNLLT